MRERGLILATELFGSADDFDKMEPEPGLYQAMNSANGIAKDKRVELLVKRL